MWPLDAVSEAPAAAPVAEVSVVEALVSAVPVVSDALVPVVPVVVVFEVPVVVPERVSSFTVSSFDDAVGISDEFVVPELEMLFVSYGTSVEAEVVFDALEFISDEFMSDEVEAEVDAEGEGDDVVSDAVLR
jgi:hypothetical protein